MFELVNWPVLNPAGDGAAMSGTFRPTLATSNERPIRCLGKQIPSLDLVVKRVTKLSSVPSKSFEPSNLSQVSVLQALLNAEARFLSSLRQTAADRCKVETDIESIQRDLNHENVIHIARFFFLLRVLDCSTSEAVESLIDSHNAKVRSLIEKEDFQIRTERELQKAYFKDNQQFICMKTVAEHRRPVFAKTEIAALLFDHMSRDSAIKTLDLLVRAGLLVEQDSDPLSGTNRKLIKTDGCLEEALATYLADLQIGLIGEQEGPS